MRAVRIVLIVVMVVLFMVTMWASTSLAGSGFTLIGVSPGPTNTPTPSPEPTLVDPPTLPPCAYNINSIRMVVHFVSDGNDDGSGYDWMAVVARRTNGTVLHVYYTSWTTSSIPFPFAYGFSNGASPYTSAVVLELYDITYAPFTQTVPSRLYWSAPNSDFNRIRANAPTPAIRATFNPADFLPSDCPTTTTDGESRVRLPPDDRLNWEQGDLMAVVYPGTDSSGAPAMHVYTVTDDSQGVFLFSVTQADLEPYQDAPPPAENTIIKTVGEVNLYRLVSGEFALVIGPDKEGKNWQIIFDNIPWTYLKREQFDPATAFSN